MKDISQGNKIIQATIDKDAYQCNGWLLELGYKWNILCLLMVSGSPTYTREKGTKGTGNIWLLAQSLMGDATDGYISPVSCQVRSLEMQGVITF